MKAYKFALAFFVVFLIGCAGGDVPFDPSIVNNPPLNTNFAIGPVAAQSVAPGGTAVFPITVTRLLQAAQSRAEGDVTLSVSGVPAGASATFSANPITPSLDGTHLNLIVDLSGGGQDAPTEAAPTSFTLTITGTDGVHTHSIDTTLTIEQTSFSLDVSGNQTIAPGGTADYTVTVSQLQNPSNRALGDVTLSFSGGIPGGTGSFDDVVVTPTLAGTTTTFHMSDSAADIPNSRGIAPQTFTFTITATDGVTTRSVDRTVTISNPGSRPDRRGR
jgi:hypothetical protein